VPIAKFPLGAHLEGDRTEWHTVKAWRALAETARELKKGQLANVNGYVDYEIRRSGDGKSRRERIIRAAAIVPK
jgi:single-stranded DNA-binding protein